MALQDLNVVTLIPHVAFAKADGHPTNGGDDHHNCPKPGDVTAHLTDLTEKLVARLTAAGVDAAVVTSIKETLQAAIDAGTPLTRVEVTKVLTDAGVDLTLLLPAHSTEHHGGEHDPAEAIAHLSAALLDNGNVPADVATLVTELTDAVKAGTPLTREAVKARMDELGLTLPAPPAPHHHFPGGGRIGGFAHQIRDAYFAAMVN